MLYTIENDYLKVAVDTAGAQLMSVYSKKTDTEYLWQGDPAYWAGRAYNLFPTIGRMFEGKYFYKNKEYVLRSHGVARYNQFELETQTETKLVFLLKDNEQTRSEYPFSFEFRVTFLLKDNEVTTHYAVKNLGNDTLYCGFGGHPGINIPWKGDVACFEEHYLEFSEKTNVSRQILFERTYMANEVVPYPLKEGVKLPLQHDLFDNDAVILQNTSHCVSVKSEKDPRYVTMRYDDFKYIGFWHPDDTDAPFVCLEPWSMLPASQGVCDHFEAKADMYHVAPGATQTAQFTLEIHE